MNTRKGEARAGGGGGGGGVAGLLQKFYTLASILFHC